MPTSQQILDEQEQAAERLRDQIDSERLSAALQRSTYSSTAPQIGELPPGSGVATSSTGGYATAGPVPQSAVSNLRGPFMGNIEGPSQAEMADRKRDEEMKRLRQALIVEGERGNQSAMRQIQQGMFDRYRAQYKAMGEDESTAFGHAALSSNIAFNKDFAPMMKLMTQEPKTQVVNGRLYRIPRQGEATPITPAPSNEPTQQQRVANALRERAVSDLEARTKAAASAAASKWSPEDVETVKRFNRRLEDLDRLSVQTLPPPTPDQKARYADEAMMLNTGIAKLASKYKSAPPSASASPANTAVQTPGQLDAAIALLNRGGPGLGVLGTNAPASAPKSKSALANQLAQQHPDWSRAKIIEEVHRQMQ